MTRVVNVTLYQTGWFCVVLSAAADRPWIGTALGGGLVAAHLMLVRQPGREIALLLSAALVGTILDSLQSCAGLLIFRGVPWSGCWAPPWIVLMWMQFATLFRYALRFLLGRPRLAAVLGATGGPLAFWSGSMLGAVEFSAPAWHGLVVLAVVWAVALPLLLRLAQIGAPEAAPIYRGLAG